MDEGKRKVVGVMGEDDLGYQPGRISRRDEMPQGWEEAMEALGGEDRAAPVSALTIQPDTLPEVRGGWTEAVGGVWKGGDGVAPVSALTMQPDTLPAVREEWPVGRTRRWVSIESTSKGAAEEVVARKGQGKRKVRTESRKKSRVKERKEKRKSQKTHSNATSQRTLVDGPPTRGIGWKRGVECVGIG